LNAQLCVEAIFCLVKFAAFLSEVRQHAFHNLAKVFWRPTGRTIANRRRMRPITRRLRLRAGRWLLSLALAGISLTTLTGEIGFREDELRCEEAKKHLEDCCGLTSISVSCVYIPGGCDSDPVYPAIDVPTATCLRNTSCQALRAAGACAAPGDAECE
jgi:hypothetical protein